MRSRGLMRVGVLMPLVVWLGVAVMVGLIVVARVSQARSAVRPPSLQGTVVWPEGARPAPDFALLDQKGRMITRASLRGHVWAMTFLDSRCHKECPIEGRELAQVQRQLGRSLSLETIIVSVDPWQDTRASAQAFIREAGIGGAWHWLLGSKSRLAPVWRRYGIAVQWQRSDIVHTTALYLVDKRGDVRVADAVPLIPRQLAADVQLLSVSPR